MDLRFRILAAAAGLAASITVGGCASSPEADHRGPAANAATHAVPSPSAELRALALPRDLEDRILALDPERITPADIRDTLSRAPAPRIVLLHGGIYGVHLLMESFGEFLVGMGYPEARIRHPGDGRWSHSPYEDSAHIAGFVAWSYEREGTMPMLIGHSQGGIQVLKVLRELDGQFGDAIAVWNPIDERALARTTITDPLTGAARPVKGLTVRYASAAAAGGAALMLPNQWSMIGKVRLVPDTVADFTGFSIVFDTWAWTNGVEPGDEFRAAGTARVRNVELPWTYNHVVFPASADFPGMPEVRAWIEAYTPTAFTEPVPLEAEGRSVRWAADVWWSIRKHWALEAQALVRARRARGGGS